MKLAPLFMIAASLAATVAMAAEPPIPVAPKTSNGKTLVVPNDQLTKGTVYYAITDRDRQVYFESNAPLEKIKGQSNDVIGYAVYSPGKPGGIVAGEWHLPVESMKTGIELRDHHLASKAWLDAGAHPDVIVQVRSVKDAREIKRTSAFTSSSVTLVADVTLHGVTRTINIPGTTITLLNESPATRKVARGDLMAIRSKFSVKLADYEVSHPVIGKKVAETVALDVSLYLSTLPPERQ